ncbi:MAG: hypothetical protein EOO62_22480 [Hymenobacter sp.]|nr:MAG: hypothetical protein EOO62_22480 [Hymenobacter sp.]
MSGIFRFRRLPLGLRYVALVAAFDMVMELTLAAIMKVLHMKSNLFLLPLVAVGEVVLLSLAYRAVLQLDWFNRIMPWVVGLFSAYALVDGWVGLGVVHYATGVQVASDLLQFGLATVYFWKLLNELHVESLRREPFFWVSVGLVVYVLGDLLINLFSNYVMAHYSHQLQILIIKVVRLWFIIALYCCYSLALWMRPQKVNSLSY